MAPKGPPPASARPMERGPDFPPTFEPRPAAVLRTRPAQALHARLQLRDLARQIADFLRRGNAQARDRARDALLEHLLERAHDFSGARARLLATCDHRILGGIDGVPGRLDPGDGELLQVLQ